MFAHRATRFFLCLLLIFTPLARGGVQGWAVCTLHMITLVALTVFLADKIRNWDWNWRSTPLDKPILAVSALMVLSSVFSEHPYASVWALALFLNYIILFYLAVQTVQTRSQYRTLVYVIIGTGTFLAVFGLFKMVGANPFPWWEYTDIPQNIRRLSSTYGNPDHLAGYMEMALPLTLGFMMTGLSFEKRLLLMICAFLMLTALLLSLSRGAWIGISAGLAFMLMAYLKDRHSALRKSVAISLFGLTTAMLISFASSDVVQRALTFEQGTDMGSFAGRVQVWGGISEMIRAYPLTGTGPGTFATVFTQFQPPGVIGYYTMGHNDYLHFIAETGVLLIPLVFWMLIVFYRRGFEKLKHPSRLVRGTTLGSMGGVTAILFHSAGDFNLHIPGNAVVFVIVAVISMQLPCHKAKMYRKAENLNIGHRIFQNNSISKACE
ncbi:O-antigen polymerase [Desulfonema ishimotonii]|uniref:O-antigen polymerase n=1 Tax=Desulfonema ishimotonii TaxID=45657 RepID=A0A401FZ35_9BACT|nr:O-antigen ligase family protein [Desulfonema ishimotonii]GBC62225.1 O-antigen polymerase [Desulfonema ishimotonii]